jgi:glutathione peroxidase
MMPQGCDIFKSANNLRKQSGFLVVAPFMNEEMKSIELVMLDGKTASFGEVAGKSATLVVNVASRCGLSPQYEGLEKLQQQYQAEGFKVLGVPSGQFMQELKSDADIADYCSTTWGVSFPMTTKSNVNGRNRHPLYKALTKTKDSHGLAGPVMWNFEKFLVLADGSVKRFRPTVKPEDPELVDAIREAVAPTI